MGSRPKDINQLAKLVVDMAIGDAADDDATNAQKATNEPTAKPIDKPTKTKKRKSTGKNRGSMPSPDIQ